MRLSVRTDAYLAAILPTVVVHAPGFTLVRVFWFCGVVKPDLFPFFFAFLFPRSPEHTTQHRNHRAPNQPVRAVARRYVPRVPLLGVKGN